MIDPKGLADITGYSQKGWEYILDSDNISYQLRLHSDSACLQKVCPLTIEDSQKHSVNLGYVNMLNATGKNDFRLMGEDS